MEYITNSHSKWIEHKDKDILYVNYSGLLDDDLIQATVSINEYVKKLGRDNLLTLVDVRNSNATEKITVEALKKNASIVHFMNLEIGTISAKPPNI